jgi:hypothetical protein
MYVCEVQVFLPLCYEGTNSPICFKIASFNFDPGLYEGERILVRDATFVTTRVEGVKVEGSGLKFSFEGLVIKRRKVVEVGVHDTFVLLIDLEMADKEQVPTITDMLKKFSPKYVDYKPETDQDATQQ